MREITEGNLDVDRNFDATSNWHFNAEQIHESKLIGRVESVTSVPYMFCNGCASKICSQSTWVASRSSYVSMPSL